MLVKSKSQTLQDYQWPWDVQLAFRLAYEVHRVIGNNIEHYRKHTQRDMLKLIRAAAARNNYNAD